MEQQKHQSAFNNSIKVFISSTFIDMKDEREYLMQYTFPQLEQICHEYDIEWSVTDLRWGIPDEPVYSGETIETCLYEIDQCRPYFIGILGDRYGWIPESLPDELKQGYPWINTEEMVSITELEIRHGALNYSPEAVTARFYFRAPGFYDNKETAYPPQDQSTQTKLTLLKDKIRHSGHPTRENYSSLDQLSEWIIEDFTKIIEPVPANIKTQDAFESTVNNIKFQQNKLLKTYIRRQAAESAISSFLSNNEDKLLVTGSSGSGKSILLAAEASQLNTLETANNLVLYFSVSSINIYTQSSYDIFFHEHERAMNTSIETIFQFWINKIEKRYDISDAMPDHDLKPRQKFINYLQWLSKKGISIFILLDGLDKLKIEGPDKGLYWLEGVKIEHVKWIFSTQTLPSEEYIQSNKYTVYHIDLFDEDEIQYFILNYLKFFGKKLDTAYVELICTNLQCRNPLFLRSILDELRVYGIRERIAERLSDLLTAKDLSELYNKILTIWESNLETFRPRLVSEMMSFVALSREGLHERELLDLLGGYEPNDSLLNLEHPQLRMDMSYTTGLGNPASYQQLPRALWAPLYRRVANLVQSMNGRIQFANTAVYEVINNRYLTDPEKNKITRSTIAEYFRHTQFGPRRAEEQPWQYMMAEEWESLKDCVAATGMFMSLIRYAHRDLVMYWDAIGDRYDIGDAYQKSIDFYLRLGADKDFLIALYRDLFRFFSKIYLVPKLSYKYSLLLTDLEKEKAFANPEIENPGVQEIVDLLTMVDTFTKAGEIQSAVSLYDFVCDKLKKSFTHDHLLYSKAFNTYGRILGRSGEWKHAAEVFKNSLEIARKHSDDIDGLLECLYHTGNAYIRTGSTEEAITFLKEAELLAINNFKYSGIEYGAVLYTLADYEFNKKNYLKSYELYDKGVKIAEQNKSKEMLIPLLSGWAILCRHMGKPEESESLYKRALSIRSNDAGNQISLKKSYGILLWSLTRFNEAEIFLFEALEAMSETFGNGHLQTLEFVMLIAQLLSETGKWDKSLDLLEKYVQPAEVNKQVQYDMLSVMEANCIDLKDEERLGSVLLRQGIILQEYGHPDAVHLFHKCALLGTRSVPSSYKALGYEAVLFYQAGNTVAYEENLAKLEDATKEHHNNHFVLEQIYFIIARLHLETNNPAEADEAWYKHFATCLILNNNTALLTATLELAFIAAAKELFSIAHHYLRLLEEKMSELEDDKYFVSVVGEHAHIYMEEGNIDKALELHSGVLEFGERTGNAKVTVMSLQNMAIIYDVYKNDLEKANKIIDLAWQIAVEQASDLIPSVQNSLKIIKDKLDNVQ